MIEKYAAFRYNLDITVLAVGGITLLICLIVILCEARKRK